MIDEKELISSLPEFDEFYIGDDVCEFIRYDVLMYHIESLKKKSTWHSFDEFDLDFGIKFLIRSKHDKDIVAITFLDTYEGLDIEKSSCWFFNWDYFNPGQTKSFDYLKKNWEWRDIPQ